MALFVPNCLWTVATTLSMQWLIVIRFLDWGQILLAILFGDADLCHYSIVARHVPY